MSYRCGKSHHTKTHLKTVQASCGHEDLISQLRSNVASAEREIDMLRDVIRDRDIEQENALTEFSRLQTLCCLKLYKRSVCSRMC